MELKVYPNYTTLSFSAAEMIVNCVKKKPDALLCFATGDTPRLTYKMLEEMVKTDGIDFSKCFIIGLDEWLNIPPDNTGSCHSFLHQFLLQPLCIDQSQVHLFNAMTANEEEE